jgi:hypothetical protein
MMGGKLMWKTATCSADQRFTGAEQMESLTKIAISPVALSSMRE